MSDFPAVAPTLNLDFANSKQLDPRVTFRRASTGTYVDSDGLIKTAGINVPRFDHDPVTGVCKGLLVEESRTNSITYSEDFSNAVWTKSNVTVFSNALNSPSGGFTATKVVETIANSTHSLDRNITLSPGSGSIFLKAGERTKVRIYISGVVDNSFDIDLSVGVLTRVGSSVSQTPIITALNNSWYRVSWPSGYRQINILDNTGGISYTGDGVSGIYIWGAQLEAGSFPTSYIPTTASTVTRSADLASMTGTNFSSWYNQIEGTFYINKPSDFPRIGANDTLLGATEGTISSTLLIGNGIKYGSGSPSSNTRFVVLTNSATQADISTSLSDPRKVVLAYKTDDFGFGADSFFAKDLRGAVPINVDRFTLLAVSSNTYSRIAYWPKRLPDAQLRALTRR